MGVIYNAAVKIGKACAPVWYKFTRRLDYKFIGEDIGAGNNIQFRGSVIDHNGFHYSIPYAARSIVRTDPRDGSQVKYSVTNISTSMQKWVDVEIASNKKIYASPHAATGILSIDTKDPDNVVVDTVHVGYGLQARGIALADNGDGTGKGYLTTYSGSPVVRRFKFTNDDKDKFLSHINYSYPYELDPYYNYRNTVKYGSQSVAEYDCKTRPFLYRSFWGAVNGGNGTIYGIPYGSAFVMAIDTKTDKIDFLTDYPLSGNAAFNDKPYMFYNLAGKSPQWGKYRGGVLASNGCIYSFGTHARSVLKIDTSNNSVSEIPYPQEVIDDMVNGQTPALSASVGYRSTSFFSFEGPDGNIYNTFWQVQKQLSIDPTTDTITFKDVSDVINKETTGANVMYYTSASTDNNATYMAPGVADQILKINYSGYDQEEYPEVTPVVTETPTPTPSCSQVVCCSPSPTPSTSMHICPSTTPSASSCVSPSVSPSTSMHICPSTTPSASSCVSPSVTPSTSMHVCPSNTPTPTPTLTPTNCVQPSQTPLPTYTSCATCTPTSTPSISQSITPSPSISLSNTPTPSITPSTSKVIDPVIIPTPQPTPSASKKPVKDKPKKESFWELILRLLKSLFGG